MKERKDLIAGWQVLLVAFATGLGFLGGCSAVPSLKAFNGSFTLDLEGWEVHPQDRVSVIGEERILNVAMSSSGTVSLLKTAPLDPETEVVKISFKVRYQRGSVPWTKKQNPSYRLILQEPGTGGDGGYNAGRYLVNPWGSWETHEIVQLYRKHDTDPRVVRLRLLPKALVIKIIVDEGDGSFQFDEFRVQELVTRVMIEHR